MEPARGARLRPTSLGRNLEAKVERLAIRASRHDPLGFAGAALARVVREVAALGAEVNAVVEGDVPALNKLLLDAWLGKLDPGKRVD